MCTAIGIGAARQQIEDGLEVATVQRSPGFVRLAVGDGHDRIVVDLVAEPVPRVDADVSGLAQESRHPEPARGQVTA